MAIETSRHVSDGTTATREGGAEHPASRAAVDSLEARQFLGDLRESSWRIPSDNPRC